MSFIYNRHRREARAMETIRNLTEHLGIPREKLIGSRAKASGAVEDGELIWYEALHDGTHWECVYETECIYRDENLPPRKEEFLHLSAPAVLWLIEQIESDKEESFL